MNISKKSIAILFSLLVILSGMTMVRCARQGSPSGGPKDEDPPAVVLETPPNRTVYFNYEKVTIAFSEFIQLKDIAKEIFISPPMRVKPEYKVAGKKVIIEFKEELKENSTYTINFGNSIVDYTESNPLVNYEYVFSTGSHIDSLSIPGNALNAFDHKPEPGIMVMVYQDNNDTIPLDSLPLKIPPRSASKTTKEGTFSINNLSAGRYMLFALEDLNNNFIYDLPDERIAFLDSMVTIEPPIIPVPVLVDSTISADSTLQTGTNYIADTTFIADTADIPGAVDSNAAKSFAPPLFEILPAKTYTLYLFTKNNPAQRLMSKKLIGQNLLQYIFQKPVDSAAINPFGFQAGREDWYLTEYGVLKDTVNFYLKHGLPDTIRVIMNASDSISDTSKFVLSKSSQETRSKKKETVSGALNIASTVYAGSLDLNKQLMLKFPLPVEDYDPRRIHLYTATDTLIPVLSFPDTLRKNGLVEYKWIPGELYHLFIEDSVFCDLGGAYNDSTDIRFKVRTIEDYGLLMMNITVPDQSGQYIIELMTDKDMVIRQKLLPGAGMVRFDYLMPGNYKLKAIFDSNSNGKWDTGDYEKRLLPERIEYYQSSLSIRANWDLQEEWKLE